MLCFEVILFNNYLEFLWFHLKMFLDFTCFVGSFHTTKFSIAKKSFIFSKSPYVTTSAFHVEEQTYEISLPLLFLDKRSNLRLVILPTDSDAQHPSYMAAALFQQDDHIVHGTPATLSYFGFYKLLSHWKAPLIG